MAIFPNVCLWRRSYGQNWEVLTLKNCYSIAPPSYASAASVDASYGPRFFSTVRFGKIRATCENFLGKWFTALPGKKFPVRLWGSGYIRRSTRSSAFFVGTARCFQLGAARSRSAMGEDYSLWSIQCWIFPLRIIVECSTILRLERIIGSLCDDFSVVKCSIRKSRAWYINIGNRKKKYTFIPTSLFRDRSLFRGFNDKNIQEYSYPIAERLLAAPNWKNRAVPAKNALESVLLPQPWCIHLLQRHIWPQVTQVLW